MPAFWQREQVSAVGFACVAQIQMECPRKSLTSMDPFLPQGLRSSGMLPRSACSPGSNDFLGSFHEHAAQVLRTILGLVLGVDSFLARVFLTLRFLKKVARVFFQRRSVLPRATKSKLAVPMLVVRTRSCLSARAAAASALSRCATVTLKAMLTHEDSMVYISAVTILGQVAESQPAVLDTFGLKKE